jgi:hypothetical protein
MPTSEGTWKSKLVLRLFFKNAKNEKQVSKVKNLWLYMPTTRGRWRSKLVLRLLFKNTKNEKQRSFSTLPRTWTTSISTNLIYLGKECVRTWDASTILQICVNGLRTKGCFITTLKLLLNTAWTFLVQNQVDDNLVVLEPPC